jgi:hypothetical protein
VKASVKLRSEDSSECTNYPDPLQRFKELAWEPGISILLPRLGHICSAPRTAEMVSSVSFDSEIPYHERMDFFFNEKISNGVRTVLE